MTPIASERDGTDRRAELIPAELLPAISDAFVGSCDLYDEYVRRLGLRVLDTTGLAEAARTPGTATELITRAGLDQGRSAGVVDWLLRFLAAHGAVQREGTGSGTRYTWSGTRPTPDPDEIRSAQQSHDASALPSYDIARAAAEGYPKFLRGDATGDEILFSGERLELWPRYFSNANSLYAINNLVGAIAIDLWCGPPVGAVLELGGGLGSGAEAVVRRLIDRGRRTELTRYYFTDLSPLFLRRAQRSLARAFDGPVPFEFGVLDINAPFAGQHVAPATFNVVFAVNTLHVARDLSKTLAEIRAALVPGGKLIIAECLRPHPGDAIYAEFVFQLMEPFRVATLDPTTRPTPGFLTPEQWQAGLTASGFDQVRVFPDVPRIRETYPAFVVGAIGAVSP